MKSIISKIKDFGQKKDLNSVKEFKKDFRSFYDLPKSIMENYDFQLFSKYFGEFKDISELQNLLFKHVIETDINGKVKLSNNNNVLYNYSFNTSKTFKEELKKSGLKVQNSIFFKKISKTDSKKDTNCNCFEIVICSQIKNKKVQNIIVVNKEDFIGNRIISYYDENNNFLVADLVKEISGDKKFAHTIAMNKSFFEKVKMHDNLIKNSADKNAYMVKFLKNENTQIFGIAHKVYINKKSYFISKIKKPNLIIFLPQIDKSILNSFLHRDKSNMFTSVNKFDLVNIFIDVFSHKNINETTKEEDFIR